MRDLIGEVLRRWGYNALTANGPAEAESRCLEFQESIDVVLSDFNLRGLNGAKLAERLRMICPHIKFIFMAADPAVLDELTDRGFSFLEKPFSFTELRAIIHERLPATP